MQRKRKLLFVGAHPDDETLGAGGILAHYAAEEVAVAVLIATRGQRGWTGAQADSPGPEEVGRLREAELRAAIAELGIEELVLLNYMDGDLRLVDSSQLVGVVVAQVRRFRPDVVLTFDPFGSYGHPDHIAIAQATLGALVAAADPEYSPDLGPAHRVVKLYYMIDTPESFGGFEEIIGDLAMEIDNVARRLMLWPDWAVTTRIDTAVVREQWIRAAQCYGSQLPVDKLGNFLAADEHRNLWSSAPLYRAYSLVDVNDTPETDLFAGIE